MLAVRSQGTGMYVEAESTYHKDSSARPRTVGTSHAKLLTLLAWLRPSSSICRIGLRNVCNLRSCSSQLYLDRIPDRASAAEEEGTGLRLFGIRFEFF